MSDLNFDFVIIGAGIVGLTIARELKARFPSQTILILEKESEVGLHGSGRNSGVLHSGIYYPPESYKAKFCAEGRVALTEFCHEHKLPFRQIGKILVPTREEEQGYFFLTRSGFNIGGLSIFMDFKIALCQSSINGHHNR